MILIDPASGWQYGFPKPYTKPDDQSLKDWLIENGYPEKLAQEVEENKIWCRYIEVRKDSDEQVG
jgi:hypothetical protein